MRQRTRGRSWRIQGGAAILTAMLTVVLVATLATTVLWQQWRGIEVEAAERSRTQSAWILVGGLDMARLQLRIDYRTDRDKKPQVLADYLSEGWAVALEPMRLSAFLAADRSDALAANETQEAFLSGQIIDLQARLNIANLVQGGKIHLPSRIAFARLFALLNLPTGELELLAQNLLLAQDSGAAGASTPGPAPATGVPLWPQDTDQLAWLGLSPPTLAALRPYITVLPVPTPVNLNTAPAEVIYACVEAFELADAHRLVRERNAKHLASWTDAGRLAAKAGMTTAQFNPSQHSADSHFFEVYGKLRVEQTTVQEHSVVRRDGLDVKTLSRQRGVAPAGTPLQ